MVDLSGTWLETISGTNSGSVTIDIRASGESLDGSMKVRDDDLGQSFYVFKGELIYVYFS